MKLEDIKKHWEEAGKRFPKSGAVTPTSRDPYLGLLERENILSYLEEGKVALEVGCGDGFHTLHYAKRLGRLSGIDIAKSLISIAEERAATDSVENVDFAVGSVLEIEKMYRDRHFDCIISQRCLINLPGWKHQQEAVLQAHRLLKEDGMFLLTEGFEEELENLNFVRRKLGLSEIKVVEYNKNISRTEFEALVSDYFDIVEVRHYGAYLFLSRVYHPLAVLPKEPKHDSRLNEIAMEISRKVEMPDLEKYSYNLFYALKKR